VSPFYHLELSSRSFGLHLEHFLSKPSRFSVWDLRSYGHWKSFNRALHFNLEQFAQLPSQSSPYRHLFSFARLFLWIFRHPDDTPWISLALTKSIESLALAFECDYAPNRWLHRPFGILMYRIERQRIENAKSVGPLRIGQEQAMAMQHSVQRVEAAIRTKVFLHSSFEIFHLNRRRLIQCSAIFQSFIGSIQCTWARYALMLPSGVFLIDSLDRAHSRLTDGQSWMHIWYAYQLLLSL
jgi:hypothetical protein